jgi:hypothetical protein
MKAVAYFTLLAIRGIAVAAGVLAVSFIIGSLIPKLFL